MFNHIHSFSERVFKKLHSENPTALLDHNKKYFPPFLLEYSNNLLYNLLYFAGYHCRPFPPPCSLFPFFSRSLTDRFLTRVYPFGLRFGSSNQEPSIFWRTGAQLVALNWQKFDLGMQQNEALFRGSGGMVLKPEYVHKGNAPEVGITIQVCVPFL